MPILPLPPGGSTLHGGDLPVTDGDDVLEQFDGLHQDSEQAPVRDALIEAFAESHRQFQDVSASAIAQTDPLRATGDNLVSIALEHEVAPYQSESESSLRARMFEAPNIVTPDAIVEEVNKILATVTDVQCQLVELEMDGLFVHSGLVTPPHPDITAFDWIGYWQNYGAIPWGSTVGIGTFGSVGALPTELLVNNLGAAKFSSTRVFDNVTPSAISNYIAATGWSFIALVNVHSSADGNLIATDNGGFWQIGFGPQSAISVSQNGVTVAGPGLPGNVWTVIQARFDGTNLSIRVDDDQWHTAPVAAPSDLTNPLVIGGVAGGGVNFFDGQIAALGLTTTYFDDATFDQILYALRDKFRQQLGTGPAWDSFIGVQPRYPDRYYEEDCEENDGFYIPNNEPGGSLVASGYPRSFHLRLPALDGVDEDFAFAIDSDDDIMPFGDGANFANAEADGSDATSIFGDGLTTDAIYAAIVGKVNAIKGQGISWSADVVPGLTNPVAWTPEVLPLTGFYRDYNGGIWQGAASAGTSGIHTMVPYNGPPAPPLFQFPRVDPQSPNGHGAALLVNSTFQSPQHLSDYFNATSWSFWMLTRIDPDTGTWMAFVDGDGWLGIRTSDGGHEIVQFDTAFTSQEVDVPWEERARYRLIQASFDGSTIRSRIDNEDWVEAAALGIGDLTFNVFMGVIAGPAQVTSGSIAEAGMSKSVFDSLTFDRIREYVKARYKVNV